MAEIDYTTPWFQLSGNQLFGIFRTWTKGTNVNVLLEVETRTWGHHGPSDWKMELQRYTSSKTGWQTIGTKTGWVSETSSSRRTFTNVAKRESLMRVKITFKNPTKSFYSGTWGTLPSGSYRPL